MDVTLGMLTDTSAAQLWKASLPMDVTFGMLTDASEVHW